ncbi:reverse transcriptase-like protein [Clostridium botulinum]|nr:reverse transcriptase-like protein [Clostridium botulinum]
MSQKSKIYAVRIGLNPGIYETWSECQKNVVGFKGSDYKSFTSKEEAELYLSGEDSLKLHISKAKEIEGVVAYIDGSFSEKERKYSFGCILIDKKGIIIEKNGCGEEPIVTNLKNVAGEIQGAMFAVQNAIELGSNNILIRHDYEGIAKWVNKEWRAKDNIIKEYVSYMEKAKGKISIDFEKVQAHSGDRYNEKVDLLAKQGLKSKNIMYKGDTWIKIDDITAEDISLTLEILKEENELIDIKQKNQSYGFVMFTINFKKEKVVLRYDNNNKNLLIQGKFGELSSIVLTYISQIVEPEQMDTIRNECFEINIDKKSIDEQFNCYLNISKKVLSEKMRRVLRQAVYNINIDDKMDDASFLIYPAVRGLEGVIKLILGKYKIDYSKGFGDIFEYNNETKGYNISNESYRNKIGSQKRIGYLCKMYTHYNKQRHPISHWNDPYAEIDDTKIIENCSVAQQIIRDTLQIIEGYYNI